MNRSPALAAAIGALFLTSLPSASRGGEATRAPSVAAAAPARSPMMVEIESALAAGEKTVAEAAARLPAAKTRTDALAIQREIERAKIATEVSVLRIQAAYARREGRPETAAKLEADAELMLRPRPRMAPAQVVPPAAKR